MVKEPIIHKDRFGRELGNDTVVVAATGTREIDVCTIVSQGERWYEFSLLVRREIFFDIQMNSSL